MTQQFGATTTDELLAGIDLRGKRVLITGVSSGLGVETARGAGVVAAADEVGGRYCENCGIATITEEPLSPVADGARPYALDPHAAKALWSKSEEMVGERF